jgi:hypothetical protein
VISACKLPTTFTVDESFVGLNEAIVEDKTIHLLVVHGMGIHCIGYAHNLIDGVASELGLTSISDVPREIEEFSDDKCVDDFITGDYQNRETDENNNPQRTTKEDDLCWKLSKKDQCELIVVNEELAGGGRRVIAYGYIRTTNYAQQKAGPGGKERVALRAYELTWDIVTRWAKEDYLVRNEKPFIGRRYSFNRDVKRAVVNDSFSDAVMYVGDYRHQMQYPLLLALCKILESGATPGSSSSKTIGDDENTYEQVFVCKPAELLRDFGKRKFSDDNEVAVVTHSLGTRMLFDTLGFLSEKKVAANLRDMLHLGKPDYEVEPGQKVTPEQEEDAVKKLISDFRVSLKKIFVMTNQVPLLELSAIKGREDYMGNRANPDIPSPGPANLGVNFQKFVDLKTTSGASVLQIVSFTDHNDLLSYDLKCSYASNVLRYDKLNTKKGNALKCTDQAAQKKLWREVSVKVKMADVSMNIAKWRIPSFMADPISAHTEYFADDEVFRLIAKGCKRANDSSTELIGDADCES